MEDKQVNNQEIENEEIHRIKLTRHLWEDEATFLRQEETIKRLKTLLVVFLVIGLLTGWIFGTLIPLNRSIGKLNSNQKYENVMDIMSNQWLFGGEIDDVETRLETQALKGLTTNEEDPHTEYMSAEEVKAFSEGINRNFIGIGVEFISDNGVNIIQGVFKDSPAEKAGVLVGDIITAIDGEDAEGLNAEEVKERVIGEEGSDVTLTLSRQGKTLDITITRGQVNATVIGEILENNIGYLRLYQFGESTADDMDLYLNDFVDNNVTKLIVDLRDNGGGYLTSLNAVASRFLPENTLIMKEEYYKGDVEELRSQNGKYIDSLKDIVILVNEGTASAAEVFSIALSEQRDDVTLVGNKTYGKGTVQITKLFDDGSGLKYTTSRWLSPNGVWVNNQGIEPDVQVDIPEIMQSTVPLISETDAYGIDSVADAVKTAQLSLDFLGYSLDRKDGYFSKDTETALKAFEESYDLKNDGILDEDTLVALLSAVNFIWNTNKEKDPQYQKALEILNG